MSEYEALVSTIFVALLSAWNKQARWEKYTFLKDVLPIAKLMVRGRQTGSHQTAHVGWQQTPSLATMFVVRLLRSVRAIVRIAQFSNGGQLPK